MIGYVAFSPVAVEGEELQWVGLAPLAVDERYRGQGIGRQLVYEGLDSLNEFGYAAVVTLAWLTERTALAGRQLWSALAVAPLAIPAFVQSYAWVSAVPSLHGLSAGVFLSVLAYYPFIYMPVAAVLRRLDPTLEDVAASLGTPPWKVFFRVVLPQLRLAICGGALLVALHLLAEYGR